MLPAMSTEPKKQKPKPGPDPERLIIDEDPKEALRRLLRGPILPTKTRTTRLSAATGFNASIPPPGARHHGLHQVPG